MRPLVRSLFVFSLFGLLAAHVSTGVLARTFADLAPESLVMLDRTLATLLVNPLGPEVSVWVLLAVGAFFALWAFMAGKVAMQARRQERYSTW